MSEREQARFNRLLVGMIGEINKRIDDCFANISASGLGSPKSIDTIGNHCNGTTVPASSTYYLAPMNGAGLIAVGRATIWPIGGTLKNLSLSIGVQPASGNLVVTLEINTVATALTITVPAGGGGISYFDNTHTVALTAGDTIRFACQNNATAASGSIGAVTMQLESGLV